MSKIPAPPQDAEQTELYARVEIEPGVWVDMLKVHTDPSQAGIATTPSDAPVIADFEDTITRRGGS